MKKFMLRGNEQHAITKRMPKSFEYGTWYNLVTPFDWQYFKLKKGSRYVEIYDFIGDKKPEFTITRRRFIEEMLKWAKSPPNKVSEDKWELYLAEKEGTVIK
ncbi:hypothetical protein MHB40_14610 [Lysinibacillus sp. FSL K6-0057]|uniref:hypothetical protein n=1 Tax=Lysinibacillus sp. FSL K6-0057 TaxID=2921411 RepID=UPI003159C539